MKTDLAELQKEIEKTTKELNLLGISYDALVENYKEGKKRLSKEERKEREKWIKEEKEKYNSKKKYAEDLFTTLKEINKKQFAEELLANKGAVEQSKALGEEEVKNVKNKHVEILAAEKKFGEDIKKYSELINKDETAKAAKKEKKEKWKKEYGEIAKDTAEISKTIGNSLNSVFEASSKFMDGEIAEVKEKLETD